MNAVANLPHTQVMRISNIGKADIRDIVTMNNTVVHALTKRKSAEVEIVSIPDKETDMYRQRIILMRSVIEKGDVADIDPPSLEDLAYTDLPWMGPVSIAPYGKRKFRSQYAFTAAVEVVREFDGLLYGLYCDVKEDRGLHDPVVITIKAPTRHSAAYKILTDSQPTPEMLAEHLPADIPEVPQQLADELVGLGWIRNGNKFHIGDDITTRIAVRFFGKIITPI